MEYHDLSSTNYVEEAIKSDPQCIKKFTTERSLAEHFNVSRTTIRNALRNLELEGILLQSDEGLQYNDCFQINMLKMTSFTEELKIDASQQKIRMLSNQVINATPKLKDFFGSEQSKLIRIIRQRYFNQVPVSYEISYLPQQRFYSLSKRNLNNVSLYYVLQESYQVLPNYGREEITCHKADKVKANYLQIDVGTPLYKISSYNFDTNDQPFEHTDQFLVGNSFTIITKN